MADEFDGNGWAQVHHASSRGFIKSLEYFLKDDPDLLELETKCERHLTPFLCAVDGGKPESVQGMIDLGANVQALSAQNHGAIEICALKFYIELLEYFIKLDDPRIPVWKNLLRFLSSESEDEAEPAGKCLRTLTQGSEEDGLNPNWELLYKNGGIPVLVKVAKSSLSDEAKIPAFETLLNVIKKYEVKEQFVSAGGVPTFIKLLKSNYSHAIQLAGEILKELATEREFADVEVQNSAIVALVKVLQSVRDPEVLVEIIECLGNIAEAEQRFQSQIGTTPDCIQTIVDLFEGVKDRKLLHSLARSVGKISHNEEYNQNLFIECGVLPRVVVLTTTRNHDLQNAAVEAIHKLAYNNPKTQSKILHDQIQEVLLKLLKTTRTQSVKETTASALWALAGTDFDVKRYMAVRMEVTLMIEFVNSLSENLQFIGSEGLNVLSQGPLNLQNEIARLNGIAPLGRLIQSDSETIVHSVIKTIRYLCVSVGYVPNRNNQNMILQFMGIKHLIALMVHSQNELIQAESALTLGCIAMGNQAVVDAIAEHIDFSFVRIVKMMYTDVSVENSEMVRLLAGAALATFAYNNINQQKKIADQGGVRFNCFVPFLQSDVEFYRCNAAFQVVVLSKIIPDEEQALSSAAGIKLLVDILQFSTSTEIQALAADCVARLAHTRAGVPSALVAIQVIEHLFRLLTSPSEHVRGCAAIALGYLSFNHTAERQLLNKCRAEPYLIRVLLHYTKQSKISPAFLEGWKHYKKVGGLPPIPEGKINLIGFKPEGVDETRPITMLSLEESNSNARSNSNLMENDGAVTLRSSRSGSRQTHTQSSSMHQEDTNLEDNFHLSASQTSLDSQKSMTLPEVTVAES